MGGVRAAMKHGRGEIQIFSTSFLDLLSCGLGAVLLLLFAQMAISARKESDLTEETERLKEGTTQAVVSRKEMETETERAKARADSRLGVKTENLGGVVFCLDFSGSMKLDDSQKEREK